MATSSLVGYAERAVEHLVTVPLSSTTHWSRSRTAGIEGRAAADFYAAEGIEATVQDKHETEAYITFAVPNADMPMSPDEAASWFRKLSRRASDRLAPPGAKNTRLRIRLRVTGRPGTVAVQEPRK